MVDPNTANIALAVPTRGSDPGTWDVPMNGNSNGLDGFIGGTGIISLSNANVTLTAPSGAITPGAGPTQSQNRTLKFTGALTGNVAITLPLPGQYTIQNLTTGNFVVTFNAASAGKIVSTPQGSIMQVWNDGTDVWLIKNQIPGELKFLGGVNTVPSWIAACTLAPFLLCDGTVYNTSVYPALGNLYLANFGGNGTTTFGVEDLRGRVPLAYDGTGTRITVAGCGINGQTLGASQDKQTNTLIVANLPPYTPTGPISVISNDTGIPKNAQPFSGLPSTGALNGYDSSGGPSITGAVTSTGTATLTAQGGTSTPVNNVQPAQVAGIWLVAT